MAVKHIPAIPVGSVLDNLHDTYMVSKMNHPANIAAGWDNFKFLLENAKEAGLHNPVDYKDNPREYCGMTIHDNPYYDA